MTETFPRRSRSLTIALVIGLIGIAFALRFWNIDSLPSGLYPDEAVNGIDAIRALENHSFKLFYENNNGREGLFINLQALALAVFGIHIWALKLFSVVFGTLTVFGVYLVAKELWQRNSLALVSAFFITFSYWAINFSRIGFRAIMVPFLLTFSLYFLLRGLRTLTLRCFLLSGVAFGLGLHTYIAFRVAPLILVIFFVGAILSYRDFLKRFWKHILMFILGAFIAALPMFSDFAKHPEHFSSRSTSISILSPDINHGHLLLTLGETLSLSLLKYNFWGDQNWRHNYPPYPNLDPFVGTLFLLGCIVLCTRIITLLNRRLRHKEYAPELANDILLLGWFFVMLIPEFLTNEGLPHSLRSIGTLPVVFLIATRPLLWLREWYAVTRPIARLGFMWVSVVFLVLIAGWNTAKYFLFFANNPNQHGAFNQNFTNMAHYINALPAGVHVYVYANAGGTMIDNGLPVTAQPIAFLSHNHLADLTFITPINPTSANFFPSETVHNVYLPSPSDPSLTITTPAIIIPMNYDGEFIAALRQRYPNLVTEKIDLHPETQSDFTALIIK
jgi:4-amino-4-deoxy-L-arabinose transferase-like glycosyltransferase